MNKTTLRTANFTHLSWSWPVHWYHVVSVHKRLYCVPEAGKLTFWDLRHWCLFMSWIAERMVSRDRTNMLDDSTDQNYKMFQWCATKDLRRKYGWQQMLILPQSMLTLKAIQNWQRVLVDDYLLYWCHDISYADLLSIWHDHYCWFELQDPQSSCHLSAHTKSYSRATRVLDSTSISSIHCTSFSQLKEAFQKFLQMTACGSKSATTSKRFRVNRCSFSLFYWSLNCIMGIQYWYW